MVVNSDSQETPTPQQPPLKATVALMPCGSLFEDFFDTIGVSLEILRTEQTGGWMFNYIEALQLVGVRPVLIFISANVSQPLQFTHEPTGATVCILPAPLGHRLFRWITRRTKLSQKAIVRSLDSYFVLPWRHLIQELQNQQCRAIIFQDYENPSFDVCVLLGKFVRIPVFATFQGANSARSRLERRIRPLSIRACAGLMIGSGVEIQRVQAQYHLPSDRIARIFNPMDVIGWQRLDRQQVRSELGISATARIVVCHGRIDIVHKGLDILLEAWQQICRERPDRELCLLLVGTGKDAPELHARIAALHLTTILWVDEYIRDRVLLWRYLCAADGYILASRYEGFPVAPIEAMACELPIVATDVPGIPEMLEGGEASGGIVVPREDASAIVFALGRILDDPSWGYELGKRARQRAEKVFSLQAIGEQMREFLFKPIHPQTRG